MSKATQHKRYSTDSRESAIKLAVESNQSIRKTAQELGINMIVVVQYASPLYRQSLKENDFVLGMNRKGNCWDNAPSESFFHTLQTEFTHHSRYASRDEAKQGVSENIKVFYNHSTDMQPLGIKRQLSVTSRH